MEPLARSASTGRALPASFSLAPAMFPASDMEWNAGVVMPVLNFQCFNSPVFRVLLCFHDKTPLLSPVVDSHNILRLSVCEELHAVTDTEHLDQRASF